VRIAIIGGGFAGATLALHLARQNKGGSLQLDVFEPRERLGAGATYTTADPGHRVNIRAERMSLDPGDRDHFARWFEATGEAAADPGARSPAGQVFPRRETFGRYVAEQLQEAAASAGIALRHHRVRAAAIAREGHCFVVTGADGTRVEADSVALCLGNPAAEVPRQLRDVAADSPKVIVDPWVPGALQAVAPDDRILILGTGLTMADVVVSLLGLGHRGEILAVSRRGLLPRPRSGGAVEAYGVIAPGSLRVTMAAIRRTIREAAAIGRSWQDVIETVRTGNAALWAAFSEADKRRFLRHVKPYWDVHRFQMAPQVEGVLSDAIARGQLTVGRASLQEVAIEDGRIVAYLRPRGADLRHETVDAIVNCTGPSRRALFRNPVVASLAAQHLVRSDAFDLGLDVDEGCRARAEDGEAVPGLYVVGPPTRGTKGEVTGASEVAEQAAMVARSLLADLAPAAAIA
jgi:uncharacterized NAD(P)/FAD-binding protein YdhS